MSDNHSAAPTNHLARWAERKRALPVWRAPTGLIDFGIGAGAAGCKPGLSATNGGPGWPYKPITDQQMRLYITEPSKITCQRTAAARAGSGNEPAELRCDPHRLKAARSLHGAMSRSSQRLLQKDFLLFWNGQARCRRVTLVAATSKRHIHWRSDDRIRRTLGAAGAAVAGSETVPSATIIFPRRRSRGLHWASPTSPCLTSWA